MKVKIAPKVIEWNGIVLEVDQYVVPRVRNQVTFIEWEHLKYVGLRAIMSEEELYEEESDESSGSDDSDDDSESGESE